MPGPEIIFLEDSPGLALDRARAVLNQPGGVIAFPTDTVYGLLAGLDADTGYQAIYTLKQRPHRQPLQVLTVAETALARGVLAALAGWPEWLARFTKGQATVVLDAESFAELPEALTRLQPGPAGVRLPGYPPLQALLASLPYCAAWSTSANLTGEPPLSTSAELLAAVATRLSALPLAIISRMTLAGQPSQVIRISAGVMTVLRA